MWRESGLNWTDFLPEGEDVQAFVSQQVGRRYPSSFVFRISSLFNAPSWFLKQKLQFVLSDNSASEATQSRRILLPEELSQQLERLLLEDMASDEKIFDWVEV